MHPKFPILKNFFSAYLSQDFDMEFGSTGNAIRAFGHQASENERVAAISELEEVITSNLDEEQLKSLVFRELGCYYYYPADWNSGIAWLKHVSVILRELSDKGSGSH